MTENRDSGTPPQQLDFERAEFDAPSDPVCASCRCPIADGYYTLGPNFVCPGCRAAVAAARPPGNALTRLFGALLLGAVAAAAGCGLWMLVTELTGYEIGLIAIAVGYLVGTAVHLGSRRTGGLAYQLLAGFLTYTAIVMTYVPTLVEQFGSSEDFTREFAQGDDPMRPDGRAEDPRNESSPSTEEPAAKPGEAAAAIALWFVAIPLAYAIPFMLGFENAIGILIIGFAVWQAWRMNKAAVLDWHGPFRLGEGTAGGG